MQRLTRRRAPLYVGRHKSGRTQLLLANEPVLLRTASEHYGAIINRAFRFERYVPMLARSGCNVTRTFAYFRELQSPVNPYSTCKPESIDYIAPYPRVTGMALDGQPLYDLDQWNDEYFDRLHRFLTLTEQYGIVVELTIHSNVYGESVWALQPFHPENNVNNIGECRWSEFMTMRNRQMRQRQEDLVRKIVAECGPYDHVLYEICNEPGAGATDPNAYTQVPTTIDEVNGWLAHLIGVTRETDRDQGASHLIAGQGAFRYDPWEQPLTASFEELDYDIVNVHPLPNTTAVGDAFELGQFMSGELRLGELARFCLRVAAGGKPVNLDEDNAATQYTNDFGWSVHRRRAWVSIMSGCHYDMIDFTIRPGLEFGSKAAQNTLRLWTWILGSITDRFGLAGAEAWPNCTARSSDEWIAIGCRADHTYLAYVALGEERPHAAGGPEPKTVELELMLPHATYEVSVIDPGSGRVHRMEPVQSSGSPTALLVEDIREDTLIVFQCRSAP